MKRSAEVPKQSLRQRLLVFLFGPFAAMLLFSLAADYRIAYDTAQEAYDRSLSDDALALARAVEYTDGRIEVVLPEAAEAILRTDSTEATLLAAYGPQDELLVGDAVLRPDPVTANRRAALSDEIIAERRFRKATYRVPTGHGPVTVVVAETVGKRERAAARIAVAMILPNILIVCGTLLLVFFGVRRGLAPLNALSKAIARRSRYDLSPLPEVGTPAEIGPLIAAMDDLIKDLHTASAAQQTFLATAAHQLRTPLASLQTQIELAAAETPEAERGRLAGLSLATERVNRLVRQLLALARSSPEAGVASEFHRLSLDALLRDEASTWFSAALARDIDLGFELEPATVHGSAWLLRELFSNLIDNALQYTSGITAAGVVTVRCGTSPDGSAFAEVEDNGPGIPAAERERVFDRFYRPEGSPGLGTGLGLAIVQEVADRHSARVSLGAAGSGGTLVRLDFPPPPAA